MARDRRHPVPAIDRVLGTSRGGHPSDGPSSHRAVDLPHVRDSRLRVAEPLPRPPLAVGRDIDRVELNRNYGYMWGAGGFGTSTSDPEYRGPGPFSEPESQAIRDLAVAHPPVLSISYHSAGQWVLYPWSYTRLPTPDDDRLSNFAV